MKNFKVMKIYKIKFKIKFPLFGNLQQFFIQHSHEKLM